MEVPKKLQDKEKWVVNHTVMFADPNNGTCIDSAVLP